MDLHRLLTSLSQKIIIQFSIIITVIVILLVWNFDFIRPLYLQNQQTQIGIIINSTIVGLLILGLCSILIQLFRYQREEKVIALFIENIQLFKADLIAGLPEDSIVATRYSTIQLILSANGTVNHSALSALLTADESTRFGLIRFINNILILTGVFGTIVSLSIALLGASDLIDSVSSDLGGMGLVIHGMSTALSTTITAILSYMLFGYFYTRLNDVQTHLLSGVEHLTSVYLLPRMTKTTENIVYEIDTLMQSVHEAAINLKRTQEVYQASALTLQDTIHASQQQAQQLSLEFGEIKSLLREGFRLPDKSIEKQV